jgi:hypothetical protein
MRLFRDVVRALNNIDRGVILSVEELPPWVMWELWENGLVKGKNKVTSLGDSVLKGYRKMCENG